MNSVSDIRTLATLVQCGQFYPHTPIEEGYMKRAYILGVITGLVLLIVAGVAGFQIQQRDKEEAAYKAELVDAVPVEAGILTETQRFRSRLFSHYRQLNNNKTIREIVEQAKGHTKIVGLMVAPGLGPAYTEPETPENYFGELTRSSNAVIRGRVIKGAPYITEDEGFVVTDYSVEVTEILKNNAIDPLEIGSIIIVTRPGGKVVSSGIVVKASDRSFEPLPQNGNDLVLFLQYIPEARSYKATNYSGSFALDGLTLRPLTSGSYPPGVLQDVPSFLRTARTFSKE
jgi:hypothetical protein